MAVGLVGFSGLAGNENFHDIQKLVGQITERYDRAYYLRCIVERRYPVELWDALGEADLLGLGISPEWGGSGGGLLEETAVVEALGRTVRASRPGGSWRRPCAASAAPVSR
jgi:alkylation response protein AidB-like acyl-CoA dehydrogenase